MAEVDTEKPVKPKRERKPKADAGPIILRVPAAQKRPWELTEEEVNLVKNHIAKGCTDDELHFCLSVAKRYKLDPFRSQIWFVKRRDKKAQGGYRWIPIVGINGLLHVAARDHKHDFGSNDEPEYGPMIKVEWTKYEYNEQTNKRIYPGKLMTLDVPEWARVRVWKKGLEHPTVATVFWSEIYPNLDDAPLVRQMPRLMLGKCALAQAIRRAYPATDGLYAREEFAASAYEAIETENAKASLSRVEAIDQQIKHFRELTNGTPPNEEQLTRLEAGETPEQILLQASLAGQAENSKPKEIPPEKNQPAPSPAQPNRIAWIRMMPDHDLAVSGYLADEKMQQFLADISAVRFKSQKDGGVYWRFAPEYVQGFQELCKTLSVELVAN